MAKQKGFTLIEMVIVLIILGIIVKVAIPMVMASIEQTKAQSAQNNLMTLAAAESKYYEDSSSSICTPCSQCYYSGVANLASPALFSGLGLSMTPNDAFTYTCTAVCASGTSTYSCTASDGTDTLNLNPYALAPNHSVSCSVGGKLCPANLPYS